MGMIKITVDRDALVDAISKSIKFDSLERHGVRNWPLFYDALSEIYSEPDPEGDYDHGYDEMAKVLVDMLEKEEQ